MNRDSSKLRTSGITIVGDGNIYKISFRLRLSYRWLQKLTFQTVKEKTLLLGDLILREITQLRLPIGANLTVNFTVKITRFRMLSGRLRFWKGAEFLAGL